MSFGLSIHESVPIDAVPRINDEQINASPPSFRLHLGDERVQIYRERVSLRLERVARRRTSPVTAEGRLLPLVSEKPAVSRRSTVRGAPSKPESSYPRVCSVQDIDIAPFELAIRPIKR